MNFAVPVAVGYLYHLKHVLVQGDKDRAWMLLDLKQELGDWHAIVLQTAAWPNHLDEILKREPTQLGFCDASSIGAGGRWFYPDRMGMIIV